MLNSKSIGNKIAAARKKTYLSQAELAQQVAISPQAVGKWERGESTPDIITLNRLAEIFSVDLNYFSDGSTSADMEEPTFEPEGKHPTEFQPSRQKKKHGWNMSGGNWAGADFSGLKNLAEKLSASNMQRCLVINSDLSNLLLKGNNIDRCDFSNSHISNCQVQGSNFAHSQFRDCSFKDTEFWGSFLYGCDFNGANFTGAMVKSGGFEKNKIANAVWNQTSFIDTHLVDLAFEGTLENCAFENCAMTRVTFQKSVLVNTFFKYNHNLKRVKFIDCKADRMTFELLKIGKADLSGITVLT